MPMPCSLREPRLGRVCGPERAAWRAPIEAERETLGSLGSHRGRFGACAWSGRDHRHTGAENRVDGENDQGVRAPVAVEVNDIAHGGDGGTGWQDLTEGSPEAREKLGGRASARRRVADDQEQERADRRPGYSENHLKGCDGQPDREDEQRGHAPHLEEVVRKGPY